MFSLPPSHNLDDISTRLGTIGVIPVVVLEHADHAEPLAQALLAGGLPCAEITFRTDAAADSIAAITRRFPEMLVGAGTVLSTQQAEHAREAGARFIITPGFDATITDWCIERRIPILPGVMTPTEIMMALAKGLTLLKFFPAETAGGLKALKDYAAPFRGVKFMPTGGINPTNLAAYLRDPIVHACGGSWMVSPQLIAAGHYDRITELASEAVEIVSQVRTNLSNPD